MINVAALVLVSLASLASAGETPSTSIRFGLEGSGGVAGLDLEDFAKAASDNGGDATRLGWTGGGRVIAFLPVGIGLSAGYGVDGGGRYENTITGFNKKKAAALSRRITATYEQAIVPVSLHYRMVLESFSLGVEAGVDFGTATIAYSESDSLGGVLSGDLTARGTGFHLAAEGGVAVSDRLSFFLRAGYAALALQGFRGTVTENGVVKEEDLFMVKDSGTGHEQLEVSTSNSITSSDHRSARVGGAGVRLTAGVRFLF